MHASIHALAAAGVLAAGVLAAAAPASALTVQTVPASAPAGARFSDPDAALESAGSSLRAAIAGGGSQDDARPPRIDAAPTGSDVYGALYAADPVGFMAHARATTPPADAADPALSPQVPPQRR